MLNYVLRADPGADPNALIARVITACDALDAMLSDRPYRAAMPRSQALVELLDGRGLQFDSDVVGALVIVARLN